eukprot:scaffold2.g7324.t1
MASKTIDLCIFGATGFTGERIAKEAAEVGFAGALALAGRSRAKLERLAASLEGLPRPPAILEADVGDPASLVAMAAASSVVINTVGPFRLCDLSCSVCHDPEGKANYLDVSGEPEFIEKVEFEYGEAAAAAGVLVGSAFGFDSVPGDLSVLHAIQQFEPPARCTLVESCLTICGGPAGFRGARECHFPTYQSAVYGFAAASKLRTLRRRVEAARGRVDLKVPGPKPPRQTGLAFDSRFNAYTFPFMGADASVIRRTMQRRVAAGKPAANVAVAVSLPDRTSAWLFALFGAVFSFLAARSWGRALLLRFPRLFSYGMFTHEGPSERQLRETTFSFTNIAKGYSKGAPSSPGEQPDMEVVTRVSGPEPGYISCAIFIVATAQLLLEHRDALGAPPGVHTPGSLLGGALPAYVERVRARGVAFERVASPRLR